MKDLPKYIAILVIFILALIISFIINRDNVTYETTLSYVLRDITVSNADGEEIEKIKFTSNHGDPNILESSIVYKDDVEYSSQEYVVDEEYNIVSIKSTGEQSFICDIDYTYEENILRKEIVIDGSPKYLVLCEYDENGWRKKVSVYNGKNELMKYYVCVFDEETQEEKVSEYDKNDVLQYYYENICTAENQPVKVLKYKENGELVSQVIFGYFTHRESETIITQKK